MIDFGAVARLPDGHPEPIGRLIRLALAGDAQAVLDGLREEGFIKPDDEIDARGGAGLPAADARAGRGGRVPVHPGLAARRGGRGWPARESRRTSSSRKLNLPPSYLLIHRVTLGSIGVLCQLEAKAPYRAILREVAPRLRRRP